MKSHHLISIVLIPIFVAGCAAVRPVTDMAAGAGGGYIADKLSNGNPAITAAGAAGGVLLSEGGFYLAGKESDKAYTILIGWFPRLSKQPQHRQVKMKGEF
jgi:hypothetical protein